MNKITSSAVVNIDNVDYEIDKMSDAGKLQIGDIQFVDAQILQLQNELAISNTARNGYLRLLSLELGSSQEPGG